MPGPMMAHGRDMRGFDHSGMGGEFRIAPPGIWWKNPGLVQRVGLTPEQSKKMDDIFQQSRLQLVDLKANLEKQNLLLEPMLSANPIDQGKALAQIDKVAQARADLEKANAKMLLGIRAVLTPEQWTQLQTGGRDMGRGSRDGASGPGQSAAPGSRGPGRGGRGPGGPPAANPEGLSGPGQL
jgi:Spy/CpxP family protein refolding chaperone